MKYLDLHELNEKFEGCREYLLNNEDMKFESVTDMKKIIETTSLKNKLKSDLKIHMEISNHLGNEISKRSLFCLSETEQDILDASRAWAVNSKLEKIFSD